MEDADPPAGYIGEWPPHPEAVAVQKLRVVLKDAVQPTYRPPEYFGDREGYWDFQDAVEFGLDPYHPDPIQLSYFRMLREREAKRLCHIEGAD